MICDFAPIHYLLTDKIPIYCLLQYQFSDYLPDSDKWTIGHLDNWTNVQLQKEPHYTLLTLKEYCDLLPDPPLSSS